MSLKGGVLLQVHKNDRLFRSSMSQSSVCTAFLVFVFHVCINKTPLYQVTAEDETGISIWDLRKPKVPIQQLPGHTHWYLFK